MTAGPGEIESVAHKETNVLDSKEHPAELNKIFEHLSVIKKITFKSQQIDDPELNQAEKMKIAEQIFNKSKHTFLMRFGAFLDKEQLFDFERFCLEDNDDTENESKEMSLIIEDFKQKLNTRKLLVKNRRYAAMQDLLKEGEYFSEIEMMKRAPELYEELIGQYLTESEKKVRDNYDVRNTTFSGILMHTMDRQEMNEVMEEVAKQNKKERKEMKKLLEKDLKIEVINEENSNSSANADSQSSNISLALVEQNEDLEDDVPANYRQQWGNFDNEQIACSTSRPIKLKISSIKNKISKNKSDANFITAGERDLLRQEFLGIMQENFLSGQDQDFDYEAVDDNSTLDDLKIINQDKEDAYFEESDGTDDDDNNTKNNMDDEESEDELDIYMRHLNQHHSLQTG